MNQQAQDIYLMVQLISVPTIMRLLWISPVMWAIPMALPWACPWVSLIMISRPWLSCRIWKQMIRMERAASALIAWMLMPIPMAWLIPSPWPEAWALPKHLIPIRMPVALSLILRVARAKMALALKIKCCRLALQATALITTITIIMKMPIMKRSRLY